MEFTEIVERAGLVMEGAGVAVIVLGAVAATIRFGLGMGARRGASGEPYRAYRQAIGRGILLRLEVLVAGDIIRTVAVDPMFQSVGVLAIIVLIRTFLSLSLQLELEGRWPWQPVAAPDQ